MRLYVRFIMCCRISSHLWAAIKQGKCNTDPFHVITLEINLKKLAIY